MIKYNNTCKVNYFFFDDILLSYKLPKMSCFNKAINGKFS